jgi:signal transduction histidine kinase
LSLVKDTVQQISQALAFLAINVFAASVVLTLLVIGLALSLGLAITVVGGLYFGYVTLLGARQAGALHIAHLRLAGCDDIARPHPLPARGGLISRLAAPLGDSDSWRAFAFWWVQPFLAIVTFALVFSLISAGLVGVTLPFYAHRLEGVGGDLGPFVLAVMFIGGVVGGLAGLVGAPVALRVNHELARMLLGRAREAELEERVTDLDTARAAALDAAERERRRIERDLHDGTQQRLVTLAVDLGMAKEKLGTDPEAAQRIVSGAHNDIKETMAELRNLTRGLRPSVLQDRGLDAALSAVAARCPFPVEIHIDLDERPPASVESAAYFVVTEALTNVTRHAEATRAGVSIGRQGTSLVVEVIDNGRGGARAVPGGGLDGLVERLAGFEGVLIIDSPTGGPTAIKGVLPCGS